MTTREELAKIKRDTMKLLNITDESRVSYITEELLKAYENAVDVKAAKRQSVDENGKEVANKSYTDYGHDLVFQTGSVLYSNGPAGSNYKCGNQNRWKWRSDPGDEFRPKAICTGSDYWYELYCPTC